MRQQTVNNTTASFLMADTWGNAQVASANRTITVDITGRHYAVDASLHVDRAFVQLSIRDAHRLGEAIIAAAAAASDIDVRQPGLWSDATTVAAWHSRRGLA